TGQAAEIAAGIDQARRKRDALNQELERDAETREKLNEALPEFAAAVARLELLERQRRELQRSEEKLQSMPADLTNRLAAANDAVEDLSALSRALPILVRLRTARQDLVARIQEM